MSFTLSLAIIDASSGRAAPAFTDAPGHWAGKYDKPSTCAAVLGRALRDVAARPRALTCRLDVARLSAEHSTAFSLPGVSHVRHGEPVSTVPAISAGAMRGWDDAGGQASPGAASRAPADSAAGPHGSQGNGLSHITTVVDSVAERSPTEAYAGTGGGGAGPSGPGQAGPSEGQPSEQPGADIADSAAASVALGAEPSLADVDAGPSGVLEGAPVSPPSPELRELTAKRRRRPQERGRECSAASYLS